MRQAKRANLAGLHQRIHLAEAVGKRHALVVLVLVIEIDLSIPSRFSDASQAAGSRRRQARSCMPTLVAIRTLSRLAGSRFSQRPISALALAAFVTGNPGRIDVGGVDHRATGLDKARRVWRSSSARRRSSRKHFRPRRAEQRPSRWRRCALFNHETSFAPVSSPWDQCPKRASVHHLFVKSGDSARHVGRIDSLERAGPDRLLELCARRRRFRVRRCCGGCARGWTDPTSSCSAPALSPRSGPSWSACAARTTPLTMIFSNVRNFAWVVLLYEMSASVRGHGSAGLRLVFGAVALVIGLA